MNSLYLLSIYNFIKKNKNNLESFVNKTKNYKFEQPIYIRENTKMKENHKKFYEYYDEYELNYFNDSINSANKDLLYFFLNEFKPEEVQQLLDRNQSFLIVDQNYRLRTKFYHKSLNENEDLIFIYELVFKQYIIKICITGDGHGLRKGENAKIFFITNFKEYFKKYFVDSIKTNLEKVINNNEGDVLLLLKTFYYEFAVNLIKCFNDPEPIDKNPWIESPFQKRSKIDDPEVDKSRFKNFILKSGINLLIQIIVYDNEEIIKNFWLSCGDCILLSLEHHTDTDGDHFVVDIKNLPQNNYTLFTTIYYKFSNLLAGDCRVIKDDDMLAVHSALEFGKNSLNDFNFLRVNTGFYVKNKSSIKVIAFISVSDGLYDTNVNNLVYSNLFDIARQYIVETDIDPKYTYYAFFLCFVELLLLSHILVDQSDDISILINADKKELDKLQTLQGFKLYLNHQNEFVSTFYGKPEHFLNDKWVSEIYNPSNSKEFTNNLYNKLFNVDDIKIKNKSIKLDQLIKDYTKTHVFNFFDDKNITFINRIKNNVYDDLLDKIKWDCFNWDVIYDILRNIIIMDKLNIKHYVQTDKISFLLILFMFCNLIADRYGYIFDINYYYLHNKIMIEHYNNSIKSPESPNLAFPIQKCKNVNNKHQIIQNVNNKHVINKNVSDINYQEKINYYNAVDCTVIENKKIIKYLYDILEGTDDDSKKYFELDIINHSNDKKNERSYNRTIKSTDCKQFICLFLLQILDKSLLNDSTLNKSTLDKLNLAFNDFKMNKSKLTIFKHTPETLEVVNLHRTKI